jgi:leader peptidase (prepilin peptidase) / N-methyltransferase
MGAAGTLALRRLTTEDKHMALASMSIQAPVTAVLFAALTWRIGVRPDLAVYLIFATLSVLLTTIDLIEYRLPVILIFPGIITVSVVFAITAICTADESSLTRALISSFALTIFYLILALASGGGLGAGDVKLGGLLGLVLGWLSWPAPFEGTFLGWSAAAITWIVLRFVRHRARYSPLPMGPFLLFGALVVVLLTPS